MIEVDGKKFDEDDIRNMIYLIDNPDTDVDAEIQAVCNFVKAYGEIMRKAFAINSPKQSVESFMLDYCKKLRDGGT